MATAVQVRDPREFLDPQVWDRQIALLTRDNPFDTVMAERLFGQAVAYLITAIEKHGQNLGLGCGELVDTAVHAFILDTGNYAAFCDQHHGRFLHHIPEIDRKADGTVARTAEIIEGNGFAIDWPLWEHDYTKCSPCRPGENCH
ncbi:hypothetical protein [Streptacidiphilus sp. P02-A3a]|uniref:glycine-rich domain-containing protein n=1 Tax=Streptacidiphilus sp. P02-A3a TaxID=2704468 RepID=UPI0015FA7CC0|nr:hypothetical protein [Streptacidiphilus sp. P02-A3a]QMU68345.1 hypothetical protein GXP74_09000 [Streptacidiphilus sp. P02-A3a]